MLCFILIKYNFNNNFIGNEVAEDSDKVVKDNRGYFNSNVFSNVVQGNKNLQMNK